MLQVSRVDAAGRQEADALVSVRRREGLDHFHSAGGLGRKELHDAATERQGLFNLARRADARGERQSGLRRMLDHGRIESRGNGETRPSRLGCLHVIFSKDRAGADKQFGPMTRHGSDDFRGGGGAKGDFGHGQATGYEGVGQRNGRVDRLDGDHWHDPITGNFRKY